MEFDNLSERDRSGPVPYQPQFEMVRDRGRPDRYSPSYGAPAWEEEEGLDWRYYLHLLWQRKLWIILATVLGVGGGLFLSQAVDPIYETRSTIWVESGNDAQGPIQGEEVFQGQGWSDLFMSMAILRPVAEDMDLYLDPQTRRSDRAENLEVSDDLQSGRYRLVVDSSGEYVLKAADDRVVDSGSLGDSIGRNVGILWSPNREELPPGTELSFVVQSPALAASQIRENLTVLYNPRAGNLITTRFSWDDPQEASRILDRTVQSFLDVAYDIKTQKLREVVGILERQSNYAQERLTEAELALENARVENVTLPNEPDASPVQGGQSGMDPVFQAYFEKRLRIDDLRSDLEQLRSVLNSETQRDSLDVLQLRSISAVNESPELLATLEQLAERKAERRSLRLSYTDQHPAVEEVSEEIRQLTSETVPVEVRQLASRLQNQLDRLQGDLQSQQAELRDIPPRLIEEERLRREMQQAEQLHSDLLSRLKSAQLAASTSRPNLQVVDRAQPPGSPTSNDGPRLFLMASLAGLGLGVAGALLHHHMDNRVRQPDHIRQTLGLPVLGLVPRIRSSLSDETTSVVLESFRAIRAQLDRSANKSGISLVITSPEPRDGKSLISGNLAISFASARRSTLLIDGDLRRGNAHLLVNASAEPGLADYLNAQASISDIIKPTEVPGLAIIPRGNIRNFDPDRLDGPELGALFDDIRGRFDAIICDTPPLGAGSDAFLFGEECDQALLVIRTGTTDRDVAKARLESSMYFDFPLVGAILNDVPDSAPYYRYYSHYGYYLEPGEIAS